MKKNRLKMSIVIITRNRCASLKRTIESIAKQNINAELIVVDNCSEDGTRAYLETLTKAEAMTVSSFFLKDNLGVAGGRNYGFERADGEYVYFIDDDATIDSDENSLQRLCDILDKDGSIGAIATYIYDVERKGVLLGPLTTKHSKKIVLTYFGGSHVIRKSAVGSQLYPDCIMYGSEELYASYRLYDAGYIIVYDEDFKVCHHSEQSERMSPKEISINKLTNWYMVKRLLLPGVCMPLLFMHYIINLAKLIGFNVQDVFGAVQLANNRYCTSIASKNRIKLRTVRTMIRDFGIVNTF